MNQDLLELKKMVEALLRSDGLVEWVGGYVYGQTSQGDPFVVLYPAAEHLKEKVCRVYPHQFKKLPPFIPTEDVPADTENNPSKGRAQRAGIYHECPPFKIVMHLGRETQMGREKRFGGVLYVPPPKQPPAQAQPPATNGTQKTAQAQEQPQEKNADYWRERAARAEDPFMFDTAIVKAVPWFGNSANAKKFREAVLGLWDGQRAFAYVPAMEAYAEMRQGSEEVESVQAHRAAKENALQVLEAELEKV